MLNSLPFLLYSQIQKAKLNLSFEINKYKTNRFVFLAADLEVGLSSKGPILDVTDLVLCEIEVSKVCETEHGGKEHSLEFVLIQPQVVNLRGQERELMTFR